jgi:hypothetical protein
VRVSRGREILNGGYESGVEPMRVCKSDEVVLEVIEWTYTGHKEIAFRSHESTYKDHGSACTRSWECLYKLFFESEVEA